MVAATRYVLPLREGGSLPAVVEGNDLGTYVIKFRGAGQGPKALVAEVIVGELFRRLGLRVPELKLIELDPAIGKSEPDFEIQELLIRSAGLNLAVDFLPGSFGYDATFSPGAKLRAEVLWLDAFTANVDRSWRNPNLLVWHKELWMIDHGAALYFHHSWMPAERFATLPFDYHDHVFADSASDVLAAVDEPLAARITPQLLTEVIALVPGEWLTEGDRERYLEYLLARLANRSAWVPGGTA
ncbi:hypothetical protein GCM10009534_69600 [Kribbella sandramycini]|nr:HipA family kinase [Kribbella sandramycini]